MAKTWRRFPAKTRLRRVDVQATKKLSTNTFLSHHYRFAIPDLQFLPCNSCFAKLDLPFLTCNQELQL
jgi:hypothetical protein